MSQRSVRRWDVQRRRVSVCRSVCHSRSNTDSRSDTQLWSVVLRWCRRRTLRWEFDLLQSLVRSMPISSGGFLENHDFQATRIRFNANNQQQQQQQQQYGGNYHNRGGGGGQMNYPPNPGPMPTTTQVTIPHALSASILGPRGTRIAQIRQQSGCVIKFDDPLPSNDRIISIIGMPNNILQAQYLMQTAVKQWTTNPSVAWYLSLFEYRSTKTMRSIGM